MAQVQSQLFPIAFSLLKHYLIGENWKHYERQLTLAEMPGKITSLRMRWLNNDIGSHKYSFSWQVGLFRRQIFGW